MPDTAPARLPGVPRWRRGIYGMRAHSTNGQRRAVCSQLCKTTHMLPVPVRLWSEHAFHIPRASPSLPLPHPPVPARRLGRLSSALKKNSGVIDKGVGIMVY